MFSRVTEQERQFSRRTIQSGTGKAWEEWKTILDGKSYRKKDLSDVIKCLTSEHHLSQGWARTIASCYILDQMKWNDDYTPRGR
jgi:hypothetical protein